MTPILYGPDGKPLPPSGNTDQRRTENTPQPTPTQNPKKSGKLFHRHIPKLWSRILSFLGIVATVVGIYAATPRLSLTPAESSYDDSDPFRVPLYVRNDGMFTAYAASLACTNVSFANATRHNTIDESFFFQAGDLPLGDLAGGGYATTACTGGGIVRALPLMGPGDKIAAHMSIIVTFRPSFWWKRIRRTFYLRATSEPDKHIHWMVTSR